MDTIKKVLHPNKQTSNDATPSQAAPHTHADAATTAALGSEPNVTGTNRPIPEEQQQEHKKPRAGHHHPLQPVGATGLPPNHRPREDFAHAHGDGAAAAEAGNNFPGTNPQPTHSALGNESLTGGRGSVVPGQD